MRQDGDEDVIVTGPRRPLPAPFGRLSAPRRHHVATVIAVACALLLGLGLGGSAVHLWHTLRTGDEPEIHLSATLTLFDRFEDQAMAVLTVHNLGDAPVTVYEAELYAPGLEVRHRIWPGPPYPSIAGGRSHGATVQVRADCSREVVRGASVRLSAALRGGPRQDISVLGTWVGPSLHRYYREVCPLPPR